MFPLFGKSSKSPTEVVKALRESLNTLEKGGDPKKEEKAQEEVGSKLLKIGDIKPHPFPIKPEYNTLIPPTRRSASSLGTSLQCCSRETTSSRATWCWRS